MQDIEIVHELNNNYLNRYILIHHSGKLDVIRSKVLYNHWQYLNTYMTKEFAKDTIIQNELAKKNFPWEFHQAEFRLVYHYNMIIFCDITDLRKTAPFFTGLLIIPPTISNSQYQVLVKFLPYIYQFHDFYMVYGQKGQNAEELYTGFDRMTTYDKEKILQIAQNYLEEPIDTMHRI